MVFSSQVFLFYFLPLALVGYYALPRRRRNLFLSLSSYVFYGWWSPWFVTLMLASTVIDWFCGVAVTAPGASQKRRKRAVATSVSVNLLLLGFFKYFMFAQANFNRLLELFGADAMPTLMVVLPVGISFYTFQSMSYTIDLYRGHAKRARTFGDFACYVSMFPQLVAGPIVRYREIAEQLNERPQRGELFHLGALNFMVGFAKKVLLANTLGEVSDLVLEGGTYPAHVAWFGVIAHAFQYYFDFSGYSDMAIGLGQMFGLTLPVNFRGPYRSTSMTEFWTRWHISLSAWLRDYLYIPLGGNRGGTFLTSRNLFITLFMGGVWHGAEWTFLIWGALHGGVLVYERFAGSESLYARLPHGLRVFRTFLIFALLLVLFRAPDLEAAWIYAKMLVLGIAAGDGNEAAGAVMAARAYQPVYLVATVLAGLIIWGAPAEYVARVRKSATLTLLTFVLFVMAVVAMFTQAENPFLYFQF